MQVVEFTYLEYVHVDGDHMLPGRDACCPEQSNKEGGLGVAEAHAI